MTTVATRPSNNTGIFDIPQGLEPKTCCNCGAEVYHIPNVAGGHEVVGADGEWHHLNCPEPRKLRGSARALKEHKRVIPPLPSHLRSFVRQMAATGQRGMVIVRRPDGKEGAIHNIGAYVVSWAVAYLIGDTNKARDSLERAYQGWKAQEVRR